MSGGGGGTSSGAGIIVVAFDKDDCAGQLLRGKRHLANWESMPFRTHLSWRGRRRPWARALQAGSFCKAGRRLRSHVLACCGFDLCHKYILYLYFCICILSRSLRVSIGPASEIDVGVDCPAGGSICIGGSAPAVACSGDGGTHILSCGVRDERRSMPIGFSPLSFVLTRRRVRASLQPIRCCA